MGDEADILHVVRTAAAQRILFLPHAVHQMLRPDRMIRRSEVVSVIETGRVIEHYPQDARGHSYLMLGSGDGSRPIHVVCAPKEDYLAIITTYLPDPNEWSDDFSLRRES